MKRRNFIKSIFGGLGIVLGLPLTKKLTVAEKPKGTPGKPYDLDIAPEQIQQAIAYEDGIEAGALITQDQIIGMAGPAQNDCWGRTFRLVQTKGPAKANVAGVIVR